MPSNQSMNPARFRMLMRGMNLYMPPDSLPEGKFRYLQNVRAYQGERITDRSPQGAPLFSDSAAGSGASPQIQSMFRLNDSTPNGPASGYALIYSDQLGYASYSSTGGTGTIFLSGLSGNPLTFVSFRPNASPQPWLYLGDANLAYKVRSDGTTYKTGIKEPQAAPLVGTAGTNTSGSFTLNVNAAPWNNQGGSNSYANYGETSTADGGPGIIGNLVAGATLNITASGTATVNGSSHAPGDAGPSTATYPGSFVIGGSPKILLGAFTDAFGNVVLNSSNVPYVYNVGASASLTVPQGAVQFQVGVDSAANTFHSNSGSFAISWNLAVAAAATVVSSVGPVTVYYWGDSPHSGPVAGYIWQNPNDGNGWGPTRSIDTASGSTSGNSFIFDATPSDGTQPVLWGILNTDGSSAGTKNLFSPSLESEGYQDFNCCIVANLFVPAAGTYTFSLTYKDNVLWGIGGSATWASKGTILGDANQTETVVSALPLLSAPTIAGDPGVTGSVSVAVTFPSQGIYPVEIDWDYWYHSGRTLVMKCSPAGGGAAATIPPLNSGNYHINAQYRAVYRSTATGAMSNPSPESDAVVIPLQANTVAAPYSSDPQVDVVDYYRMDQGLDNFTYVATGPNDNLGGNGYNTSITDTLTDTAVAANPLLQFDNYEPFPSIDLPRKGYINVGNNGSITWKSGDTFNIRWLPGTIMLIGSPAAFAYTLIARPTSTTTMTIPDVPAGNNLYYQIPEPILAAQPMPAIWGPTDNTAFYFGVGDPLRPGVLYWSKGSNFDSAPQTNQLDVTSPSEPLMNGCVTAGVNLLFSTERYWLIYPTFAQAAATVAGTVGQQWTLVPGGGSRGLYLRYCLASDGTGKTFFRAKDGIYLTHGGSPEVSITQDIYNLFPHEGMVPTPIVVGGQTIYPPDDTKPNNQKLACANGYLYYDYVGTDGAPHTLTFDILAGGWIVDVYATVATCHLWEVGPNVNGVLTGCIDGTVRSLASGNTENALAIVSTPSVNGGNPRTIKRVGGAYLRAALPGTQAVSMTFFADRYETAIVGATPVTFTGPAADADYLTDFTNASNVDVHDMAAVFQWAVGAENILSIWEPDWAEYPEGLIGWHTQMLSYGLRGWLHCQALNLAYLSTAPVTVTATTDQGTTFTLTFPSSGGAAVKQLLIWPLSTTGPNKFKMIGWKVNSANPFTLFPDDCELYIKAWGTGFWPTPYNKAKAFSGPSIPQESQQ